MEVLLPLPNLLILLCTISISELKGCMRTHTHRYIYTYIYIYVERERVAQTDKQTHTQCTGTQKVKQNGAALLWRLVG